MKYEIIDVTGNRWTIEAEEKQLKDAVQRGLLLEVAPFGRKDNDAFQWKPWFLQGDKVVAYREIQ